MKYKIKPQFFNINKENHLFGVFNVHEHTQNLQKDFDFFKNWLSDQNHAEMHFLEKNEHVRLDPSHILSGAKTALVFLFPYAQGHRVRGSKNLVKEEVQKEISKDIQEKTQDVNPGSVYSQKLISKYVYSKDYHKIIKKHLTEYAHLIEKDLGHSFEYRPVVDSIPFFERAYGRETGLGFIGKNTLLIRPGMGSFFFIGTLLTDIDISDLADTDHKNHAIFNLNCGDCTKCIDACPTEAIEPNKTLNSNKCLSYLSIEHRDTIPQKYLNAFKTTLYGCDICQDVCPYNYVTQDFERLSEFKKIHQPLLALTPEQIATMTELEYQKWFGGMAMTRARYQGLVRNALCHLYAIKSENLARILENLKDSPYTLIKKTVHQLLLESATHESVQS